ncbi:pentatricopeptide repeat-containing protein At5g39350-like [Prosopis cineraria]|uniref:pentatricopeptide repeat-containing protein At5g39350-like n=1 Tax=Prosopis cineraria TaxID=364024 RepID=UPI00240F23BC|nr:pentatricopeptide repeat-containing protein At5g39350-like [Prosopis cineraria]
MEEAWSLTNKMDEKDVVTWTTLINGYVLNGDPRSALMLCHRMQCEGVKPNLVSIASLLSACANLVSMNPADLLQAMNMHCYLIKSGFLYRLEVSSILVDIYSKCGSLGYAHQILGTIPLRDKDIVIWSAIIAAYGKHGHGEMAVSLFN